MTDIRRKLCPLYESNLKNDPSLWGECDQERCAWWCSDPVNPEDGRCAIVAIASAIRGLGVK